MNEASEHAGNEAPLKVLTHNLYLGADLVPLARVTTPADLIAAMTKVFAGVQATNFPERATALAAEITAEMPHLVCLQEVTLWRWQSPSDFPNPPNATDVVYDYLALLLGALGPSYRAVATVQNSDLEAPRKTLPERLQDIRMTDRNVILARTDLPATNFSVVRAETGQFRAHVSTPVPLPQLGSLRQGWAAVEVLHHGRAVWVVNTHLTPVQPDAQETQGHELRDGPLNTSLPTVLLGDLNSAAGGTGAIPGHTDTRTYQTLRDAGFEDAALGNPGHGPATHPGDTCCQDADLRNPTSHLSQRIDYILIRHGLAASSAHRVGADPGDRTPSGLWPSDHAGLWAVLH